MALFSFFDKEAKDKTKKEATEALKEKRKKNAKKKQGETGGSTVSALKRRLQAFEDAAADG